MHIGDYIGRQNDWMIAQGQDQYICYRYNSLYFFILGKVFGFDYLDTDSQGYEFATYEEEINIEPQSDLLWPFDPEFVEPETEPGIDNSSPPSATYYTSMLLSP